MAENSKISWTNHTFNPWIGCTHASIGCKHCYAETLMDSRLGKARSGPHGTRVLTSDANWREPLKWNRDAQLTVGEGGVFGDVERPRVFSGSLCDIFEDWQGSIDNAKGNRLWIDHSDGQIAVMGEFTPRDVNKAKMRYLTLNDVRRRLFGLIDQTPNLDWLLLTKRPENIRRMWAESLTGKYVAPFPGALGARRVPEQRKLRRDNVWLGTSVSDQTTADRMIPELLKCRDLSPVLFLSVEPLLGPVDLSEWFWSGNNMHPGELVRKGAPARPDWVIVGGESGPHARPCDVRWIWDILQQCQSANVPCFVKQLGANVTGHYRPTLKDPKGADPSEWPVEELKVREFPEG